MGTAKLKCDFTRKGFTLLEMVIVAGLVATLIGVILTGLGQQLFLTTFQQYQQDLDVQGSRIVQELTLRLRPAILPIRVGSGSNSDKAAAYRLLDGPNGFDNAGGRAWRKALDAGVDSIAFVVPVDAQRDGDTLDDANHIEVGQIRGGMVSLDSRFDWDGDEFLLIDGVVNSSLACVNPDLLADDAVGGIDDGLPSWPNDLFSGMRPDTSAFTVIRYVPVMTGGALQVVDEAELDVDLDGDGDLSSAFNIGRLQLVHVGGIHAVDPENGAPPVMMPVPHQMVDLSANVVLRNLNPDNRQPIFRLVNYSAANLDDNGIVDATGGKGSLSLAIRVNVFDLDGYRNLRARSFSKGKMDRLNREFEATVMLWNMPR